MGQDQVTSISAATDTVPAPAHARLHPLALVSPGDGGPEGRRAYWISQLTARELILIADAAWPPESPELRVVLQTSPPEAVQYALAARIVHQVPLPNGKYLIGCELTPPLSAKDLERLR